jgi:hypothetical protein
MKSIILFIFSIMTISGFAENLVLVNQTSYPKNQSKMAIQWAGSAQEIDQENQALMNGTKLNPTSLHPLTQPGKTQLNIPKNAEYFRVLVWSKGEGSPDFHTNWVDAVPNKIYTLKPDYLVPTILMLGTGC